MKKKRITIPEIKSRKGGEPIVCLTAYTAPFAKIIDNYADLILVGDSVGMVLYGMDSTLDVSVDMMIQHGKAVVKSSGKSCIVVDMPFASYQQSPEIAFKNAARILSRTGCSAVKLEGGHAMAETVAFLTERGIPVMGHIGLMPQSVNTLGGYHFQGRTQEGKTNIINDAKAIEKSGAFAIVLEGIEEELATSITNMVNIPTIGIGASVSCDGQILVTEDMVGLFSDYTPRFVKRYADMKEVLESAVASYTDDVKKRFFPENKHCFTTPKKIKAVK